MAYTTKEKWENVEKIIDKFLLCLEKDQPFDLETNNEVKEWEGIFKNIRIIVTDRIASEEERNTNL